MQLIELQLRKGIAVKQAVIIKASGDVEFTDLTNGNSELDVLQQAVGGLVQPLDLSDKITMWCNDEGKIIGLPYNPIATHLFYQFLKSDDFICGDVIFTGGTDSEGETLGLDEAEAKKLFVMQN